MWCFIVILPGHPVPLDLGDNGHIWILMLHHYLSIGIILREKEGTWDEIPYVQACMLLYKSERYRGNVTFTEGYCSEGDFPANGRTKGVA